MFEKKTDDHLPDILRNYETGEHFTQCTICNSLLVEKGDYVIEKIFKQNTNLATKEIVYEYAICMTCAGNLQGELSQDSMQAMTNLYQSHSYAFQMRLDYLHSTEKFTMESWMEQCSFTGKPIVQCSEFTLSTIIEDNKMIYQHTPMVVSDVFSEKLQAVLSKKTKDFFDDFKDEFFDLPPEIKDLINGPTVGII